MQLESAKLVDYRVASIVSALKSNDKISFGSQIIYNVSFAFVAELRSDDYSARHTVSPSLGSRAKFKVW